MHVAYERFRADRVTDYTLFSPLIVDKLGKGCFDHGVVGTGMSGKWPLCTSKSMTSSACAVILKTFCPLLWRFRHRRVLAASSARCCSEMGGLRLVISIGAWIFLASLIFLGQRRSGTNRGCLFLNPAPR